MRRAILSGLAALALSATIVSQAHAVEVYLFKGAGDFSFVNENMHFSRGLNKIAETLQEDGIHSEVRRFSAIEEALETIRDRKPKSVALIGHSMGALASIAMARNLRGDGIRVAYMGLIDIPGPVGVAGDNVEWVENYYSINPVYGLLTNAQSHPNAKNIHVAGYIHNRMDDAPRVQEGMLAAIREIHQKELMQNETELQLMALEPSVPAQEVQVQSINPGAQPEPIAASSPQLEATTPSQHAVNSIGTPTGQVPIALPDADGLQVANGSQDPLLQGSQNAGNASPLPVQKVDRVVTSSVRNESLLQRGKRFLRKTGAFVRGLSSGKRRIETRSERRIDP